MECHFCHSVYTPNGQLICNTCIKTHIDPAVLEGLSRISFCPVCKVHALTQEEEIALPPYIRDLLNRCFLIILAYHDNCPVCRQGISYHPQYPFVMTPYPISSSG